MLVAHPPDKMEFVGRRETKKFPSLSPASIATVKPLFNMIKAVSLPVSVLTLALCTSCSFSKKAQRAKENSAISADVEESFRKRWVDKRAGELAGQGTGGDAARTQAETEFRERYNYTRAGTK